MTEIGKFTQCNVVIRHHRATAQQSGYRDECTSIHRPTNSIATGTKCYVEDQSTVQ